MSRGHERAHRPRAGLVDQLGALAPSGLPDREQRAGGIAQRRQAPGGLGVHRGERHGRARRGGVAHRRVDVLHAYVRDPARLEAGAVERRDARDVAPAEPGDRVLGRAGQLPAEQLAVEGVGRSRVGLQRLDPAGDAGRIGVSSAHGPHATAAPRRWETPIRRRFTADPCEPRSCSPMTDPTERRLRVGVLGAGQIAQAAHLEAAPQGAQRRAVRDLRRRRGPARARSRAAHRPRVTYTDYDAMLADPRARRGDRRDRRPVPRRRWR